MNERELWKALVETWIRHREVELDLLRRLEQFWAQSEPEPPVEKVAAPALETDLPVSESRVDTEAPATAESIADEEREFIESTRLARLAEMEQVDTVRIAESTIADAQEQPEPIAEQPDSIAEAPESIAETSIAEVPLLLLGQADMWVGFPWDRVERVALTEEVELPVESEYRFSLGAILHVDREEEPYSLVWTQDGGPATLSCARIGGIVTIDGAADRSIELVVHPRSRGGDSRPILFSLQDFMAELRATRRSHHEGISSMREGDSKEPVSDSSEDETVDREPDPSDEKSASRDYDSLGEDSVARESHSPEDESTAREFDSPEEESARRAFDSPDEESAARDFGSPDEDLVDRGPETLAEVADSIYDALPTDQGSSPPISETSHHSLGADEPQPVSMGIDPHRDHVSNGSSERSDEKLSANRWNGGRRSIPHALVAVHYLPARVAVVRMLRGAGWSVEEEAQPLNLSRRLQAQSPDVLFVEPTGPLPEPIQDQLQSLLTAGARIVVLGSRLRPGQAAPDGVLGRAPRLHFPFTEEESRELLSYLRAPATDQPAG